MAISVEELRKEIKKRLKRYDGEEIEVAGKKYPLFVFEKDEEINLFEGFLFAEVDSKGDFSSLVSYRPPVSGYAGRIGIIFYRNEELIIKEYRADKQIRKTIAKVNQPFLKKLKKALENPNSENINALLSRSDVIEEFYVLYKKCRDYLLSNITGIPEEEKREEFVDNFMMQMLTLWYLQEKGFFNKDRKYFITKFSELKQKKLFGGFESYYEFLNRFFEQISGHLDEPYVEDDTIGKCVVIGPAVFLNGETDEAVSIPDKCFYKKGVTEDLINLTPKGKKKMISENDIDFDIPLLNLFESRDWVDGDIDEYVLGSLYEKLITYMERKKLGAFYTPEEITSYICKNTIEPYLVDRINEEFEKEYKSVDEVINTGIKEELTKLFDLLKEIKILDPAVGSAHFLESAINVLVEIYRKLRDKAVEVGIKKFEICVANEQGRIEPLNLLEIPEKEGLFEVYVKFFIILSRNIYGVDINPSALKIARARLFLTLARHFNVDAKVFIRFPNVHFNLRVGNSLIGYVELEKEEKGQVSLDFFVKEGEAVYVVERIKVVGELESYLNKISKPLKIDGDIVKETRELNEILSKREISWEDFEKVLWTKEKLIRILIASLNSQFAVPLNELLNEITEIFSKKLDERFAEEHGVNLDDLKRIKTFHWVLEFPEVLLKKGGFDAVVGNPPFIRQEMINEPKEILEQLYPEVYSGTSDYSVFFVKRSFDVLAKDGYHSFIITNKWLTRKYGEKLRSFLKENFLIEQVIDFGDNTPFVGISNYVLIYVVKNSLSPENSTIFYCAPGDPSDIQRVREIGHFVLQESLEGVWTFVRECEEEIKKWIEKVGKPLEEWDVKIYRGITTGLNEAFIIDHETMKKLVEEDKKSREILKPVITGKEIERYYYGWKSTWLIFTKHGTNIDRYLAIKAYLSKFKDKLMPKPKDWQGEWKSRKPGDYEWFEIQDSVAYHYEFEKPKIMWQWTSKEPAYIWDIMGMYAPNNVFIMTNASKYILALLNSKLITWYFEKISPKVRGGTLIFAKAYIDPIPLFEAPQNVTQVLEVLADYITFLSSTKDLRESEKDLISFIDVQVLDTLIYELYFKEKFIEDGKKAIEEAKNTEKTEKEPIYPQHEKGPFLIDLVAKYLKPIDYDSYAKLAYSIEPLSEKEKQKMEEMKEKYLKTIKEVIEAIKADNEIMGLIERIKQHEWVRVIEGAES